MERFERAEQGMQRAEKAVRTACAQLDGEGVAPVLVCGALVHAGVFEIGFNRLTPDQQVLLCSTLESFIGRMRDILDEFGLP
ncbi:MAG: hypothetical protein ACREF9_13880 [Opitutaceae bacterium]